MIWRRGADVTEVLSDPPGPPVVVDNYLPEPCLVHPEQVVEYQALDLLPPDLSERIEAWEDEDGPSYHFDLSLAPGWDLNVFRCPVSHDHPPATAPQ